MVYALRNNTTGRSGLSGFTLIEMLITVVVLGILAAIAIPNYTDYITKARRSDATINLSRIAALQEKFFTQCGFYAANFGAAQSCTVPAAGTLNASLTGAATTDGYYTIAVAAGPTGTLASSYTLTATPAGTQATRDILRCATIGLDSAGAKIATGTDGGVNGGTCWKK